MKTLTPQVRPYGIEIETPAVGENLQALYRADFTVCHDSSVNSSDCYCDCSDCSHSCDCEHCDYTNGYSDLDHCDDCQANEAQTPILTTAQFPEEIRRALEALHADNTEDGENGGHIHINAPDLTAQQVAQVQRVWYKFARLLPELIGREANHYCEDKTTPNEDYPYNPERFLAVNVSNWHYQNQYLPEGERPDKFNTSRRWTIEFRQFASTANPDTLERRASVCRALVDYIAEGKPTYWLHRAETAEQLLDLIQPERH